MGRLGSRIPGQLSAVLRTALRAVGAGALGFALTVGVSWAVLGMLGGLDGPAGLLASVLGADLPGVLVAAAASTGAPVRWWLADFGVGGRMWPVQFLLTGSPLALLAVAPLVGGALAGVLAGVGSASEPTGRPVGAARRAAGRWAPLGWAALGYALAAVVAAVVAAAASRVGGLATTSSSPPLVFAFSLVWTALVGRLGIALRTRIAATWPGLRGLGRLRAPVLATATLLLVSLVVVSSAPGSNTDSDSSTAQRQPAPLDYRRPGVTDSLAEVAGQSGSYFNVGIDSWRGVPSTVSMHSPLGASVPAWLRAHAGLFAVADPPAQLQQLRSQRDLQGQTHVWFEQAVRGVPVYASRVGVHLDASGRYVEALTNGMQPGLVVGDTKAKLSAAQAVTAVAKVVPGGHVVGTPELLILPERAEPNRPTPTTLVWKVVYAQANGGEDGVKAYFVDARSDGRVVRTTPVSEPAKWRSVRDYNNTANPTSTVRNEGGAATGISDLDRAYEYTGEVYDYYSEKFGYTGLAPQYANVRYAPNGSPYQNAYWDGEGYTWFGAGMVTRDIVAHEWTHALTQFTADLTYQDESGALNESYSDIFGEVIEHYATGHNDWLLGLGSAVGVVRSMEDPTLYGQPDHLRRYFYDCFDNGGVHANSGIPNKAFYTLAQRIGIDKAAAIAYRTLTVYLHPSAGFTDARNSSIQSAWDLYGKSSQEAREVWRAWGDVGVDGQAEADRTACSCFAESALHDLGLDALDPAGLDSSAVAGALLRTRDMFASGSSPALAHYALVYERANRDALRLLKNDTNLLRHTAHAMQSLAPMLIAVDTPDGDRVRATREQIDELNALTDAYITADLAAGGGELAGLLTRERALIDTNALVGMTANEIKAYLDRVANRASAGSTDSGGSTSGGGSPRITAAVQHELATQGHATVVIELRDKADLSRAQQIHGHGERAAYVYEQLGLAARRSQQGLRDLLTQRGVKFEQFWIANVLLVRDADTALVDELAARGEVARIRTPAIATMVTPTPSTEADSAAADGVEWGVGAIRAPEVWSTLDDRGEGITVASIDTGVQVDHPALAGKYRGLRPDGTLDNNYNFFDPSGVCANAAPCDNQGHGTHTMGTMVGDAGTNHIGVAPGAKWISAKGCETSSCSEENLLRAGEWMLAPTDVNGQNPRPDLAPDVVNNSWGGSPGDTIFSDIVNAWVQAGIFPAFANGNSGPGCGTAGAPGDYPASYGVGAFDKLNQIASFSSRGPSYFGDESKPNISAPGVAVRSSIPGNGYSVYSGTSMATPHLAATVALMWSKAPNLRGDIAATRQLLDDTAIDMTDLTCGGTADDNNVWGEGRLDAFSAVSFTPRGAEGSIIGSVVDSHGAPIAGALVTVTATGDAQRSGVTDASGAYSIPAPVGSYQVAVRAEGYRGNTGAATVTASGSTRVDLRLVMQPRYRVTGIVTRAGLPVMGAQVSLAGTQVPPTVTNVDGSFGFDGIPVGDYTLDVGAAQCSAQTTVAVTVNWDKNLTVETGRRSNGTAYGCTRIAASFPRTDTVLALSGDDAATEVTLPFEFPYFGRYYPKVYLSTNGSFNFDRLTALSLNASVPGPGASDTALYPFWDDLVVDANAQVRVGVVGTAPTREFVMEWRNVTFFDDPTQRVTFGAVLSETGAISFHYDTLAGLGLAHGESATVGFEDHTGTYGLEYLRDQPYLQEGTAITISGEGVLVGQVTDGTGASISGVLVDAGNGRATTTDYNGRYRLPLAPGDYQLDYTHPDYMGKHHEAVTITGSGNVTTHNVSMLGLHNDLTGVVRDDTGAPLVGQTVSLDGPFGWNWPTTTTDENGRYQLIDVAPVSAAFVVGGWCLKTINVPVVIDGDKTVDLTVPRVRDVTRNSCGQVPMDSVTADTRTTITGDDAFGDIALPFPVTFYGTTYNTVHVSTNGLVGFPSGYAGPPAPADYFDSPPNTWQPNGSLYVFYDDLIVDDSAGIWTGTVGSAGNRRFVIEWRNVNISGTNLRITVQAVLYENGRIRVQYVDLPDDPRARGGWATVAIENPGGTDGLTISFILDTLKPGLAVEFRAPGT